MYDTKCMPPNVRQAAKSRDRYRRKRKWVRGLDPNGSGLRWMRVYGATEEDLTRAEKGTVARGVG